MQEVPRNKLSLIMKNAVPITLTVVIAALGTMFLLKQNEVLTLRNEIHDVTDRLNRLNIILSKEIEPVRLEQITASLRKKPAEGSYEERRKNLLKDFVRVTDDFQRPRIYTHRLFFKAIDNEPYPKKNFLRSISAASTGGFYKEDYWGGNEIQSVLVLKDDEEDPVYYHQSKTFFSRFDRDFPVVTTLRCRVHTVSNGNPFRGEHYDFTLTWEEHLALLKTFELANMPEVQK